jgi:hypothetical protein
MLYHANPNSHRDGVKNHSILKCISAGVLRNRSLSASLKSPETRHDRRFRDRITRDSATQKYEAAEQSS